MKRSLPDSLFLIAGPCVIENWDTCARVADHLAWLRECLDIPIIFKSSFDKANRTSHASYRGLGMDEGLWILNRIHREFGLATITDVHEREQIKPAADAVNMLQTPAFLARQTDFIQAVASAGLPVNVKKGQWMTPEDMIYVAEKCEAVGNKDVMLCERGTSFGPNNLVVDMRGLEIMGRTGFPVVFDATHSVQRPGGLGNRSGGDRSMVPVLARAAVAAGVSGIFMETHPDPDKALSDGPNMIPLDDMRALVESLVRIDEARRAR